MSSANPQDRRRRLTETLEQVVASLVDGTRATAAGAVIRLDVPGLDLSHTAVAGVATPDGAPMTPGHAVHVASIGKLMTATLILQLAEEGRFGEGGLDRRLGDLGLLEADLLDRLHVRDGRSRGGELTLRRLLTHTAGLGDAFGDDATGTAEALGRPAPGALAPALWRALKARQDGAPLSPDLASRIWAMWDPARPSDPDAGLLNRYIHQLGEAPPALPGERFHYSDQGFVLLALIAERASRLPYAELQRRRIFEPLGMTGSWMHMREAPPAVMAGLECDVWLNGVPMLAHGANLSFDFGGGGQVMTVADMATFLDALLAGRLFTQPQTLAAMTDWITPAGLTPPRVAIGLGLHQWAAAPGGPAFIGHAGAWGAHLWRDPRTGATVAGTVNQRDLGAWAFDLLEEVHSLHQDTGG